MKKYIWEIALGVILLILSIAIYFLQIKIFNSPRDTYFYLFQDLAFLPVQVFLVTIVLNQLIILREKNQRARKMNMVIGVFFSQVGIKLLQHLSSYDLQIEEIREKLSITEKWTEDKFEAVKEYFKSRKYEIKASQDNAEKLNEFLAGQKAFLVNLLGNSNLLEHERFTEVLWAITHLADELSAREDISKLNEKDIEHLSHDIKRAYSLLVYEWVIYMEHLKTNYPYLFSLSMRTNPFNPDASAEIK